jgi:hypothetical protein
MFLRNPKVKSVAGRDGDVSLAPSDVGLSKLSQGATAVSAAGWLRVIRTPPSGDQNDLYLQSWEDTDGNVRMSFGDINALGQAGNPALKLMGVRGLSDSVEIAMCQNEGGLRTYGGYFTIDAITSNLRWVSRTNNVDTTRLTIVNANGNVGLGNGDPTTRLSVNGGAQFLGLTTASKGKGVEVFYNTGADFGQITVLDRDNENAYKSLVIDGLSQIIRNSGTEVGRFQGGRFGLGVGANTPAARLEITEALGTTPTQTAGLVLMTRTAAANNAQQISAPLRWMGNAWTGSASQAVEMREYLLPIQGGTVSGSKVWQASINGGTYYDVMALGTDGRLNIANNSNITDVSFGISTTTNERIRVGYRYSASTALPENNITPVQILAANANFVLCTRTNAVADMIFYTCAGTSAIERMRISSAGLITAAGNFEITTIGGGFIQKSPNGSRWKLSVDNSGAVSAVAA